MSSLLFKITLSMLTFVAWSEAALSLDQQRAVEDLYRNGKLTAAMSFPEIRSYFHQNPHNLFNYVNANQQEDVHRFVKTLAIAPAPAGESHRRFENTQSAADIAAEAAKNKLPKGPG
ncbi:hypothetical protein DdX_20350 [Ditylenchus destructor]|uniref:Secreted protein n=1 Tax=Ditylenchus destructor TaxID=166010 RepID=A0AAD4QTN8_9BILA|nr:hypothetical protein DdX_20350 [Ditylenchus destructor]